MSFVNSLPPKAYLVPCDLASAAHSELLYEQRVICGWGEEGISRWKSLSAEGNLTIYWLVLDDRLPDKEELITTHCNRYPKQAAPIQDTSASTWGEERIPSNESFVPIGHIGLGRLQSGDERVVLMESVPKPPSPDDVVTWIGPFYVSWALQKLGIGRLAMTQTERISASPPINGTIVALDAIAPEHALAPALVRVFYTDCGNPAPAITNHDWYLRQNYKPYHRKAAYPWTDSQTGEAHILDTVYMQKRL